MTDLKTLVENYFAGELTDEQARELSQCLIDSPIARRAVWEHAQQEALLGQLVEESCGEIRSIRSKPDAARTVPAQRGFARASGLKGSRRLRWVSTAAVVLLISTVASAAVFPPLRGFFVRWWQAVAVGVPVDEPREVVQEVVDQEATDRPKQAAFAE